jgi:hypothetical protein
MKRAEGCVWITETCRNFDFQCLLPDGEDFAADAHSVHRPMIS